MRASVPPRVRPFVERARRDVTPASVQAGLRAALATAAPLALAYATGHHALVLAGVGGWLATMADTGGAPSARARAMFAYLALGALAYAFGVLAGGLPGPLLALAVALVAAGGGLLRAGGDVGATLGILTAATFCAAVGTPLPVGVARGTAALGGGALLAAGSLWAAVLALGVWPVRPYAAAREAAAGAFRALADFAQAAGATLAGALAEPDPAARADRFTELARAEHPRVRAGIEAARGVLVATRRRRLGGSRRADGVAVLLDGADGLFLSLLTAAEAAEAAAARVHAAPEDAHLAADAAALADAFARLGRVLGELADAVPDGRRAGRAPASLPALERAVVRLVESEAGAVPDADRRGHEALRHAGAVLEHAAGEAERAAETAAMVAEDAGVPRGFRGYTPGASFSLSLGTSLGAAFGAAVGGARSAWRDAAAWARAVASPDAPTARHALRLGAAVGTAQLAGALLHVTRGPWLTITTLLVLQPSAGLTVRRSAARVAGTVAGGVVAALLAAWLRDPRLIAAAAFVLAGAAVALRPVHYAVFTFFLTPVFVLIAQPAPGDWALAGVRVVDTMLGGVVAVLAGVLLWPTWEAAALPATAAEVAAASRAHAALAFRVAAGAELVSAEALARARRRAGLAATAGEGALERLLAEPGGRRAGEALLALLARARRLNGAAAALAAFGAPPRGADARALVALGAEVDLLLGDVEAAARAGRAPGAGPPGLARLLDDGRGAGDGTLVRTAERRVPELPAWGTAVRAARHAEGVRAAAARLFDGKGATDGVPAGRAPGRA